MHLAGEVGDAGFVVVVQRVASEGVALAHEFGGLFGQQAVFVHEDVQVFALELQAGLLAEGRPLADSLGALGHVAEGVYSARTVWQRAQQLGVNMPITEQVVALLDGHATPQQALADLMGRAPSDEAI